LHLAKGVELAQDKPQGLGSKETLGKVEVSVHFGCFIATDSPLLLYFA
jgi:hypothetical protein